MFKENSHFHGRVNVFCAHSILVYDEGLGSLHDGLKNLQQFNGKLFDLDETDLSFEDLRNQAKKTGQGIVQGVL